MGSETGTRRRAVVMGGASGVGLETCRRLADDGRQVTAADVRGEAALAADEAEAICGAATTPRLTGENIDIDGGAHLGRHPAIITRATEAFS